MCYTAGRRAPQLLHLLRRCLRPQQTGRTGLCRVWEEGDQEGIRILGVLRSLAVSWATGASQASLLCREGGWEALQTEDGSHTPQLAQLKRKECTSGAR